MSQLAQDLQNLIAILRSEDSKEVLEIIYKCSLFLN